MRVIFFKVVALIFLCLLSVQNISAEENEKSNLTDEVDSSVIGTEQIDQSSRQVEESKQNVSTQNVAPDSIAGQLKKSDDVRRNILFKYGYVEKLLRPWVFLTDRLERDTGLDVGTTYSVLYQYSSKTITAQNENDAASGVLEFFGHWNVFHSKDKKHPGYLGFKIKWAHTLFTDIPPTDLDGQIGSLWQTTSTFNKQSISLDQIWWHQSLFDKKIEFQIGKVDQSDFVDFYMYSSARRFFLNEAFSRNPTIPFPETGLLGFIKLKPTNVFYLLFSLGDLNADGDQINIKSFFKDRDYFKTIEINFSPLSEKLGYVGNYHIVFWHSDEIEDQNKPSSKGFNINLSRTFYKKYGAFIRYGFSDGEFTEVKQLLSLGIGISDLFKFSGDFFGVAFALGEPVDDSLRTQYVFETQYRIQISPIVQLTPDIQLIFNPTNNPDENFLAVLGIRFVISL